MKILLLSQWYPPEPQKILSDLTGSLQAAGHELTVLTGFPNYPEGRIYPGYRVRLRQREVIEGIPVIRIPIYPDHGRGVLKRSMNFMSFAASAACIGPWVSPRADIMYVVGTPPLGAGAVCLSRLLRIPFAIEIQDIWPETLKSTGMVNNRTALGTVDRLAKFVYRNAAAIRVISPGFRDNLLNKGVPDEKIRVISNWVDTDFYHPKTADPCRAEQLGIAGGFNIMFAGTMGQAQRLDVVLDAAEQLHDLPQVRFVLVGYGNDRDRLQELARQRGTTNVIFPGRFPAADMSDLYALADVLLIHLIDDPLFRITIPHKVFTYMAAGKPIVAAIAGDTAQVINDAQAGLSCPPSDPAALAAAVRKICAMTTAERQAWGDNGRRVACEKFSRDFLVGRIAAMLEDVLAKRNGSRRRASFSSRGSA